MKPKVLFAIAAVVLATSVACAKDPASTEGKTPEPSNSTEAFGLDSHTFEGEGNGDYFDTKTIELSGEYLVKWEVSDNTGKNSGEPATFEADLRGEDLISIVSEGIADGTGSMTIQVRKPGKYYAHVFAAMDAHWSLSFTRA